MESSYIITVGSLCEKREKALFVLDNDVRERESSPKRRFARGRNRDEEGWDIRVRVYVYVREKVGRGLNGLDWSSICRNWGTASLEWKRSRPHHRRLAEKNIAKNRKGLCARGISFAAKQGKWDACARNLAARHSKSVFLRAHYLCFRCTCIKK